MRKSAEAFVLIDTRIGEEKETLEQLKKIEGVKEAYEIYGVYDIMLRIKAETFEKLRELLIWKIRRVDGVKSTCTLVIIPEENT